MHFVVRFQKLREVTMQFVMLFYLSCILRTPALQSNLVDSFLPLKLSVLLTYFHQRPLLAV